MEASYDMSEITSYENEGQDKKDSSSALIRKKVIPATLNLKRLEKMQQALQYVAALVALVFICFITYGYIKLKNIKQEISSSRKTLEHQRKDIERNQLKIDSQNNYIKSQRGSLLGFEQTIQSITAKNPEQQAEIKKTLEKNIEQNSVGKLILPRVYIQIVREDQRAHAAEIVKQLRANGFIMPGIENLANKARLPATSEIRYYESTSVAQQDVDHIASTLQGLSVKLAKPQIVRNNGSVRSRHYEIWFGMDF